MRPADRGDARLRQAERAHLALAHQIGHRADRLLDRHVRIDPVLVEKVDHLHPEPLQRRLGDGTHMVGATVQARHLLRPVLAFDDVEAELCGDRDLVAERFQPFADQRLVGERAIDFRRVEQADAELDGAMKRADRIGLVLPAIGVAHAHAAEADGADGQFSSKLSRFHGGFPAVVEDR